MKKSDKDKLRREKIKVKRLQKVTARRWASLQFLSNVTYGLFLAIRDNNIEAIEQGHKLLVNYYENLQLDRQPKEPSKNPLSEAQPLGDIGDPSIRGAEPSDQVPAEPSPI